MISHGLHRLLECHNDLQKVVERAALQMNIIVKCGYRNKTEQDLAFQHKFSRAHFGQSPHNFMPSLAVDVVPMSTEFSDEDKLLKLSMLMLQAANELEVELTWGGYFSGGYGFTHPGDLPHYQLTNWLKLRS